ncbi:MAG: hypothetical protein K9N46_14995 [Candidatus Marinimicrobia bacterium]|nr:hypothetical protein [Candidatus Neomarinimicrobiota bacterium]MCF7882038.1 hypothetical protein [Candidatus Neomarinimicrobiota bacterium]
MADTPQRDWFQLVLRILLGGIFIYAAIPKILSPNVFYLDILGYDIVAGTLAKFTALWLPWIELLAALGVIFSIWYLASLRIFQGVLAFFVVLLTVTLVRGITADCGCFGSASGQVTWWHVFGDVVLLMLATFLVSWSNFQEKANGGIGE